MDLLTWTLDYTQQNSFRQNSCNSNSICLLSSSINSSEVADPLLIHHPDNDNAYDAHDEPLLIDAVNPTRHLSIRQIKHLVTRLIAGLSYFIQPGDSVCLVTPNDILFHAIFFAVLGSGAVFSALNPSATLCELSSHLKLTNCRLLMVHDSLLKSTLATDLSITTLPIPASSILLVNFNLDLPRISSPNPPPNSDSNHPYLQSWIVLFNKGYKHWVRFSPQNSQNHIATYASTSGTSGLPKLAILTHAHHIQQASNFISISPHHSFPIRRLSPLPPFHAFASPIVPASIHQRIPIFILPRYTNESFLTAIQTFKITETFLPPSIILSLPHYPGCSPAALASLRQIWTGGTRVTLENRVPLLKLLNKRIHAQITICWGLTESGWLTALPWPDPSPDDSVGSALPNVQICVLDSQNHIIHDNTPGDILVRSPNLMLGYLNQVAETRAAFYQLTLPPDKPWLRTGDYGYVENGRVYILDRRKELIKVRAWQVSPAEVESVLLNNPYILDAAVVPIDVATPNERIRAYLVTSKPLQPSNILQSLATRLSQYKLPTEIIFLPSLPKTSTGKVLRRLLRERTAYYTERALPGSLFVRTESQNFSVMRRVLITLYNLCNTVKHTLRFIVALIKQRYTKIR